MTAVGMETHSLDVVELLEQTGALLLELRLFASQAIGFGGGDRGRQLTFHVAQLLYIDICQRGETAGERRGTYSLCRGEASFEGSSSLPSEGLLAGQIAQARALCPQIRLEDGHLVPQDLLVPIELLALLNQAGLLGRELAAARGSLLQHFVLGAEFLEAGVRLGHCNLEGLGRDVRRATAMLREVSRVSKTHGMGMRT